MDTFYDDSDKTNRIEIGDGFADFTKQFKCLASFISYHTRDKYDIEKRIAAGSKAM